ncbi:hypothetical protein V5O48_001865 [Marasmius crinis-equi]|uniref:Uncharacterized protein n=1 Tax=Marasmius crinis-equi TaxID=585013 RepID=A0ABR3FYF6_9AGAR
MHPRAADISARYTGVDNLTPYHEVAQDLGNARDFVEDCVVRAYGEAATLQTLGMGDFSLIRRGSYRAQNDGVFVSGNIVTAMCVHVEVPCDWPSAGSWPFQVKLNPSMVEELKEYMISLLIMQDGVPWVSRIERGW